jgi:hypothetical protein
MRKYDVFKSQGGYGVALGIYNNCPVVGTIRWLPTEPEAMAYADNKRAYDEAYAEFESRIESMTMSEAENCKCPSESDYNLDVGVTI